MTLSGGEVAALWSEPVAIVIYAIVALAVVAPIVVRSVRPAPAAVAQDLDVRSEEEESMR